MKKSQSFIKINQLMIHFTKVAILSLTLLFLLSFRDGFAQEDKGNVLLKSVFDETEAVLSLAPLAQVAWARGYASQHRYRSSARQIQAAVRNAFPNDSSGMQAQTSLITQLVMMGDIVGALKACAVLQNKETRQFTRLLIEKLNAVRQARSQVIQNFTRNKPPRAYAGNNPQSAARAQDRSARYTQFVQMSTQLMNELQQTERELMDALQTLHRDLQQLWEAYASIRDEESRTQKRVMPFR